MKKIIKQGYTTFIIRCPKCRCLFSYEKEDITHPHVYEFNHLQYVSCPTCEFDIFIKKNKIKK